MSDDKERELTKSLETLNCPKCRTYGSLRVEQEPDGEEILFVLICTMDGCSLREKGVRL